MIKLTYEIKGKEYDYAEFESSDILAYFIKAVTNRGGKVVRVEGLKELELDRKTVSGGD